MRNWKHEKINACMLNWKSEMEKCLLNGAGHMAYMKFYGGDIDWVYALPFLLDYFPMDVKDIKGKNNREIHFSNGSWIEVAIYGSCSN